MEKLQFFIGQFFGNAYKALSEAKEDAAMKAFETEAEQVMNTLEAKDGDIAEGVSALEAAQASLDSARDDMDKVKADLAAAQSDNETAQATIAALEAKLAVFGADDDARAAYAAEHATLQEMYADDERRKQGAGKDLNGAETPNAGETMEERKERIAALKAKFPNTFK